jgi:hypothetical protein
MPRILLTLVISILSVFNHSFAQPVLYGLTSQGGSGGKGALIKFDPLLNQLSSEYNWEQTGQYPDRTSFVEYKGKLYGMTSLGGKMNLGTIFSFDPISNIHTTLYDFENTNGGKPSGSLMVYNGKLYGMTTASIFAFDPSSNTHTTLCIFGFNASNPFSNIAFNGKTPYGSLVEYSGKLYGLTAFGGNKDYGTIFSFDPGSNTITKLLDFNNINGSYPRGSLTVFGDKLYGMTTGSGDTDLGTIFSFDPSSNTHSKLFSFNNNNGSNPFGSLVVSGGKLYGMTATGGSFNHGTIFSFDPMSNTHARLFDFNGANGRNPFGNLIVSGNKFYGTTDYGGYNSSGTIFSFDPGNNIHVKLFDFVGYSPFSGFPQGSPVISGDKLYGMTQLGGSTGFGTIYSFNTLSNIFTQVFNFSTNGITPYGSPVVSGSSLYGMTSLGGRGQGTIFSFDLNSNTPYTKLFDFNGNNGSIPNGNLMVFGGKLYGMTSLGGSIVGTIGGNSGYGTIFSFDPVSKTHTKLFDFNPTNGSNPYGSLVESGNKFFGMTANGGGANSGTIFSFDPISNTHTKLFDFDGANGRNPYGSLVEFGGNLYGMTVNGGIGFGTIFSFDPVSNTHTKLFDCNPSNGSNPYGNLVTYGGKLYGMTSKGGSSNNGTIFSYDPISNTYTKLFDFDNNNGSNPNGSLVVSGSKLFGMTNMGGKSNYGTVFSFVPATNTFSKLLDLNGDNGANPVYGAFIEYDPTAPSFVITAPANNTSYTAGSDITIAASVNHSASPVSYVEFFVQGNKLGRDFASPYTFTAKGVAAGTYRVSAIAVTNTSDTLHSDTITINVLAGCTSSGTILGEGYINIPGGSLADLTSNPSYPGNPYVSAQLSSFEYSNLGDQYGGRLRGYICAPATGDYVFYISGDDQAGLLVSTDDNPANKHLVAYATTYTGFRQWDKFSTQQSQPIRLMAGQRYYVETLHKEYIDGDHLSVGWKLPDGTLERPISGKRLSPYIPGGIGAQSAPNGFVQEMRAALNTKLQASVLPNPSRSTFTVSLKGEEGKPVQVMVTDILGRVIETRSNLQPNGLMQMGQNWKPGIYILQLQQGDQRKTLKLVKE